MLIFIASCSVEPVPIKYGNDICSFCRMIITNSRYGTEILTKKGKNYKFDSIECLVQFIDEGEIHEENIHSLLITDFVSPEKFTDAKSSSYLVSHNLPSPMGANLTGFQKKSDAEKLQLENQLPEH